ncbi:hypothetical protein IKP85_05235 [bacterium]|nr:hypothetical protein [bacterium]
MENINNSEINNQQTVNAAELETELRKFNWGACGCTWMWGLGNGSFNKTWHVLIVQGVWILMNYIPFLNILGLLTLPAYIGLMIYYGFNGNRWAFENRAWWSLEDFTATQRRWAIVTITVLCITILCVIIGIIIFFVAFAAMLSSFGAFGK